VSCESSPDWTGFTEATSNLAEPPASVCHWGVGEGFVGVWLLLGVISKLATSITIASFSIIEFIFLTSTNALEADPVTPVHSAATLILQTAAVTLRIVNWQEHSVKFRLGQTLSGPSKVKMIRNGYPIPSRHLQI
jgi:hypothetical protein